MTLQGAISNKKSNNSKSMITAKAGPRLHEFQKQKTDCEIRLHHTQGETLQNFFSLISNTLTLQDSKIMMHHTLQDTIKIIVPEGVTQHLMPPVSHDLMRKQM